MGKVVIIDDEKMIREGLATYIDWSSLGLEVVAICADGVDGMDAILTHQPDIALTDISMPNLDGIGLLEQVRSYGLSCEIIFISSYSDFHYAQQAVRLGAFDYLLKPIEAESLYNCVKRCTEKISTKVPAPAPLLEPEQLEGILADALTALPQSEPMFLSLLHHFGIPPEWESNMLVTAFFPAQKVRSLLEGEALVQALFQAEVSPNVTAFCVFSSSDGAVVCRRLEKLLEGQGLLFAAVPGQYGPRHAFHLGLIRILEAQYPFVDSSAPLWQTEFCKLDPKTVERLDQDLLEQSLAAFFHHALKSDTESTFLDLLPRCVTLFEGVYKQLEDYYGAPLPDCPPWQDCVRHLREANNLLDLAVSLSSQLADLFCTLRAKSALSPYTRAAVNIIKNRYSENLSLKSVAREINVSGSHLSTVFKADTGLSFSDYLFTYRMEIARELIRRGHHKVFEVGELVGYPDMVQFSKRFKQHFGYSPKQWQRSNLAENGDD